MVKIIEREVDALEKLTVLVKSLKMMEKAYYVLNAPIATDNEYDLLRQEVETYREKHPKIVSKALDKVGISTGTKQHLTRMLSMLDVFDIGAVQNWLDGTKITEGLICELKLDGLSLNLIYDNGKLVEAITRGDGGIGEDMLAKAELMPSIPQHIPYNGNIEIRGEIIMLDSVFNSINELRTEAGEQLLMNTRNAAAGTMALQDLDKFISRPLTFMPWGLGFNKLDLKSQVETMEWIKSKGFVLAPNGPIPTNTIEDIMEYYDSVIKERDDLGFGIDGVVIKVNSLEEANRLGVTDRYPKSMLAFKLPPIEVSSKILSVTPQVGRIGVITPVAELTPVLITGSMVSRATLHNYAEIFNKDIQIGDHITIIKSGDVIPKITGVSKKYRKTNSVMPVVMPAHCPCCKTPTIYEAPFLYCKNTLCPDRIHSMFTRLVSRDYFNIKGLGPKLIKRLLDEGILTNIESLYSIDMQRVRQMEGVEIQTTDNLQFAIDSSLGMKLSKFIAGIALVGGGRTTGKILDREFGMEFLNAKYEDLIKVKGIGEITARELADSLSSRYEEINRLLTIIKPTPTNQIDSASIQATIVFTGKLAKPRSELKEEAESKGYIVNSSITKEVDYLVIGENVGAVKTAKANKLNINILTEEAWLTMLKG